MRKQAGESGLAHDKRIAPQIVAIELDQVKGIEEHTRVMVPVPDAIKARDPVVTARDGFTIEDARPRAQPSIASTISGKAPRSNHCRGRLYSFTRLPSFRAMTRKPSCLISCSQSSPEGGCGAEVPVHTDGHSEDRLGSRAAVRPRGAEGPQHFQYPTTCCTAAHRGFVPQPDSCTAANTIVIRSPRRRASERSLASPGPLPAPFSD